jgi:MobA/MobL family
MGRDDTRSWRQGEKTRRKKSRRDRVISEDHHSKGAEVAHLHFKRTVYKSGGSAASARIEYITGQSVKESAATRQLRYIREGREDLVYERSRNLPGWAEGNPHTYFRAAERYERTSPNDTQRRGVAFEEWKVTLPQELTHAQNMDVMRDLVEAIAGDRLPITYAFHDPKTLDDTQQQPHLHLLISARQNDGHTRTPQQHFKRYNRTHPERGGAQKDPAFWHKGAIKAHRVLLSDILNVHLEAAGQSARVHPDSLEQRQLQRIPEPKLLPSESRACREQGIISARMQEVLDIRQERASQGAKEQAQARTYWEGRKVELGMTAARPRPEKLQSITEARGQIRDHAPVRPVDDLDKRWKTPLIGNRVSHIYHTPAQKHYGNITPKHQVRFWTEREAQQAGYRRAANDHDGPGTGVARTARVSTRAATLAEKFQRLTRVLDPEDGRGHGDLHVQLHAEERAHDRGMSW